MNRIYVFKKRMVPTAYQGMHAEAGKACRQIDTSHGIVIDILSYNIFVNQALLAALLITVLFLSL